MPNDATSIRYDRRRFLTTVSAGALALSPGAVHATLLVTPEQSEGPFYPRKRDLFPDVDNDLVLITDKARAAGGTILHLTGQVLDADGAPVQGALIEIWQCDANGRYLHGEDRSDYRQRDAYFQGFGHTRTDADGLYRFRTIKPVPYPGRTPHIHFKLRGPAGETLTTQMYVAGEPGNARDGLYNYLPARDREQVTVELTPAPEGALSCQFQIIVPWST